MPDAGAYDRVRAVAQGELRALARQKTPFVLRTVYAALAAAGVVTAGAALMHSFSTRFWSGELMAVLGGQVFSYVVVIQTTLAAVLGVMLGVASIAGERQNKTLGLLVLSQLRAGEIVFGKFLAILGLVATVLLAGVPVFALLGWAGGVDYAWLKWLAFDTLALAALGTATGLHFALRVQGAAGAAAIALSVMAVPAVSALPFWTKDIGCLGCFAGVLWLPGSVALGATFIANQGGPADGAGLLVGLIMSFALTGLLLTGSARILPAAASAAPGLGLRGLFEKLDSFFEGINVGGIRFELGPSKTLKGNPVAWLTRTSSGLGLPHYWFRVMAFAVLVSLFGIAFAAEGGASSRLLAGFWILAAIGVPVTAGANAFGNEKARRTLGVLLATPLTAWGLLRGKLYVFLRLLVLLVVPSLVVLKFVREIDRGVADQLEKTMVLVFAEAVLAYFVALFLSLVLASPLRAGVAAVALLAVVHLLYGAAWLLAAATEVGGIDATPLLPWVLGTSFAGFWASRNGHPAIGLAAFMAALAPLLALEFPSFEPFSFQLARAAEAAALAAFVFVYTLAFFDRAAGRAR